MIGHSKAASGHDAETAGASLGVSNRGLHALIQRKRFSMNTTRGLSGRTFSLSLSGLRRAAQRHKAAFLALLAYQAFVFVGGPTLAETKSLTATNNAFQARAWEGLLLPDAFGTESSLEPLERSPGRIAAVPRTVASLVESARSISASLGASLSSGLAVGKRSNEIATQTFRQAPVQAPTQRSVSTRSTPTARGAGAADLDLQGRGAGTRATRASSQTDAATKVRSQAAGRRASQQTTSFVASQVSSSVAQPPTQPRRPIGVRQAMIASEVQALAQSLDNSPARIFEYVHDNVRYQPTWGASKSALSTLREGQGSSWDQAWLLQQLLVAAGVDASVEWGEVEIPIDLLENLAGIQDPIRAADLLATGGIPITLLINNTVPVGARLSHVWVKAFVDYVPNRGVAAGPGDTWIRMDPSITRFQIQPGTRLNTLVPFDLGSYLASGTELDPLSAYESDVLGFLTAGGQAADLLLATSQHTPRVDAFPYIPGTLRGKVLSVAGESTTLPAAFSHRVEVAFRGPNGSIDFTWSTEWHEVSDQRVELWWPGATPGDQSLLDAADVFAFVPGEVEIVPSLRVAGVEIARGTAMDAARDVHLEVKLIEPSGIETPSTFELFSGELSSFRADFGKTSQALLDDLQQGQATASPATDEALAWGLSLAAATYLRQLALDQAQISALRYQRLVPLGTAVLAVNRGALAFADGVPAAFDQAPPSVAVGSSIVGFQPADGVVSQPATSIGTLELVSAQASHVEGEALAAALGGSHVTGVGLLTESVRASQEIQRIDQSNLGDALGEITLSRDAELAVAKAVRDQNRIAWTGTQPLQFETWDVTGFALEDPSTGATEFRVTTERVIELIDGDSLITFHSPAPLSEVTAPTDVVATVVQEGIESWTLTTRPSGSDQPARVIATGTGEVTNRVLGEFDPTLLQNGMHELILVATDVLGGSVASRVTLSVDGNMKIGHFTLAFTDLSVPLAGLDIEVVRTYDSRDVSSGDFGAGWNMSLRNGTYINNRPPGEGWSIVSSQPPFIFPCAGSIEQKDHLTTIRLSDAEVYRFRTVLEQTGPSLGGCLARSVFQFVDGPVPGATLHAFGDNLVFYSEGLGPNLLDPVTLQTYEPNLVRLTTRDGRVFDLDLNAGVTRAEDTNGNFLTITPTLISHSSGESIALNRDVEGRITQITDPENRSMSYGYDAAGDLVSATDRESHSTLFAYDGDHRLEDIIDPLGNQAIRTDYDVDGRMISTTDAAGNTIAFEHDLVGRREIITDRLGFIQVMEYNNRGNVVRETNQLGDVTLRSFDGEDNLLTETDPLGRTTEYSYSSSNDLTSIRDAAGNRTNFTYEAMGRLLTSEDPNGNVTTNVYDGTGNLTSTTDALGNETTFAYDANGNQLTETDALSQVTTSQYNGRGDLTMQTDALGNETTYTYNSNGEQLTETRTRTLPASQGGGTQNLTTTYTYDGRGLLVSTLNPDGSTTGLTYDGLGRVIVQTDQLGRSTQMAYDGRGRQTGTTFPDTTITSSTFDDEGRLLTRTDRGGRTTTNAYDAVGRLLTTATANGAVTSNAFDAAGQLLISTDALGNTATFNYDDAGRRFSTTNALGQSFVTTYDAAGNVLTSTDARGFVTSFVYDALNRRTNTVRADGSTVETEYDVLGRRVSETDAAGVVTQFGYDALGRLSSVTDALSQVTSFTYDEQGSRLTQTDANGRTTTFGHDELGRRVERILPDGASESMSYNVDGTMASRTDFRGIVTSYGYDVNRRLVSRTSAGEPAVGFAYTPTGRRASFTDGRGTTTFGYDVMDRMTSMVYPDGRQLAYSYDLRGSKTSMTATVGAQSFTTGYTYDALNRLETITDSQGGVTTQSFDQNGNLAGMVAANGVATTHSFDALNRLTSLETADGVGGVLQSYAYTLASTGHRTRIDEDAGLLAGASRNYTYDDLYRLTEDRVEDGQGALVYSEGFAYDPVGNRQSLILDEGAGPATRAYGYDNRDRLLSEGPSTYGWDDNGNLLQEAGTGTDSYVWDSENRLVTMTLADGTVVDHGYDPDGVRVSSAVTPAGGGAGDAVTTEYLVDASGGLSHVVAESLDDGLGGGDVASVVYTRANDRLVSLYRPASGEERWYHADGLGSVRLLTDAGGVVTDRYGYRAFGEALVGERVGGDVQPYQFAGESLDPNSGFYYNRARWLDVGVGRFVGMDPFGGSVQDPVTLHRYLYANVDPVGMRDSTGLYTQSFGFDAHRVISERYRRDFLGDRVLTDVAVGLGLNPGLKPDIVNLDERSFLEIKPLSFPGITAGIAQLATYTVSLAPANIYADVVWAPRTTLTVQNRQVFVVNVSGLLFYTDETMLQRRLLEITAPTALYAVLRNARSGLVAFTRLGIGLAGAAASVRGVMIQSHMSLSVGLRL